MKSGHRELSDYCYRQPRSFSKHSNYYFVKYFMFFGINLHAVALFSLNEPNAPSLVRKVILGTDLSQSPTIFVIPIREMVSHYQIRSPDSELGYPIPPPIVS